MRVVDPVDIVTAGLTDVGRVRSSNQDSIGEFVHPQASLRLLVVASGNDKCERCWHRRPEVGQDTGHPTLCGRCVENIEGSGEQRHYA